MKFAIRGLLCLCLSGPGLATEFQVLGRGTDLVGTVREVPVREGQTLADIAREQNLGHIEIRVANPELDFWLPEVGAPVLIPDRYILPDAPRRGLVLNLPEMRLYYYPDASGEVVITHPMSIGRMDWQTPLGRTEVTSKVVNPSWTPPESVRQEALADGRVLPRVVAPGPDNPLGKHAMRLSLPGYLIHGTNRPYGVGMQVTHGCIRLYPEDIEALFPMVAVGTGVNMLDQPVKIGWSEGALYIEVHPPLEESGFDDGSLHAQAWERIAELTEERPVRVLEDDLLRAIVEKKGIPVRVSQPEFL